MSTDTPTSSITTLALGDFVAQLPEHDRAAYEEIEQDGPVTCLTLHHNGAPAVGVWLTTTVAQAGALLALGWPPDSVFSRVEVETLLGPGVALMTEGGVHLAVLVLTLRLRARTAAASSLRTEFAAFVAEQRTANHAMLAVLTSLGGALVLNAAQPALDQLEHLRLRLLQGSCTALIEGRPLQANPHAHQ